MFFSDTLRATYRRKGQRGPLARALVRADFANPRAILEGLVGELVEFHLERLRDPSSELAGPPEASRPRPLPPLPPLAAALSAEAHLLSTLPVDGRPPDVLGIASVLRLMGKVGDRPAERAAAA